MNDRNFHLHIWNPVPSQVPVVPQIKPPPTSDIWNTALTGTGSINVIKTGQKGPTKITRGDSKEHWEFTVLPIHHFQVRTKTIQRYLCLFLSTTSTNDWRCGSVEAFFPIPYGGIVSSSQKSTEHNFQHYQTPISNCYQILLLITESIHLQNLLAMFKSQRNNCVLCPGNAVHIGMWPALTTLQTQLPEFQLDTGLQAWH